MEDGDFFFNVQTVWGTHSNKGEKKRQPSKAWKGRGG